MLIGQPHALLRRCDAFDAFDPTHALLRCCDTFDAFDPTHALICVFVLASFVSLATSAKRGGDLGLFGRQAMQKPFEDAACVRSALCL